MKDDIKKLVDDQRGLYEDFYEEDVSQLWGNISNRLDQQEDKVRFRLWKVAAVLLAFFITGYVAFRVGQESHQLPTELVEAETHYAPLIAQKTSMIKAHSQEIDALIWEDMEEIDRACKELKKDLKDKVDNEEVISSIITNYRIKLSILDQLLKEIESKKNEKIDHKTTGI